MMRHSGYLVVAAVYLLAAGSVSAQMFVDQKNLSSEAAKIMGQVCEALVIERGWHPATVWVIDNAGHSLYMHSMQGAPWLSIEPSRMKAQTALQTGRPNSTYAESAEARGPYAGTNVGILLNNFMAGGGLPVIVDGQVVGAIGVGGTRAPGGDEECAQASIDAIMNR
nr:MAG: heme-binding protein [Hyphomicrobiales bacterium]